MEADSHARKASTALGRRVALRHTCIHELVSGSSKGFTSTKKPIVYLLTGNTRRDNTADRIEKQLQRDGHRTSGFVIYQTTYDSDDD